MIHYSWSGWRLHEASNRVNGWWMAAINFRYFACVVSNPLRDPFEYLKGQVFDTTDSLTLEDFHDRSSSFLMGGPTEYDLNIAFEPEKTAARESLERSMLVAWLKPTNDQAKAQIRQIDNGGAWGTTGGGLFDSGRFQTYPTPPLYPRKSFKMFNITFDESEFNKLIKEAKLKEAKK